MQSYIIPIQTAFMVFPMIAFLFTLPYMIHQYRKYGSIPALRTIIVYSMVLYLINAYFLIILPLPPIDEVATYTSPTMQLVPFQFITDMIKDSTLVFSDIHTYLPSLGDAAVYQVFYNVVLLLPFGFYLRYYFKCAWWKTILCSFLLSLFFEITQLSGLYGIYPRSYRLFDVDDLMINTLGGYLGYLLTPLICLFLPSKEKLDAISYKKGKAVSYTRRLFAFVMDWFYILLLTPLLSLIKHAFSLDLFAFYSSYPIIILIYFVVCSYFMNGQTLGKSFFKIKVVAADDAPITWAQYLVRYGFLYFLLLPLPIFLMLLFHLVVKYSPYYGILLLLAIMLFFYVMFQFVLSLITGKRCLFHEKVSKTKTISTIVVPNKTYENKKF